METHFVSGGRCRPCSYDLCIYVLRDTVRPSRLRTQPNLLPSTRLARRASTLNTLGKGEFPNVSREFKIVPGLSSLISLTDSGNMPPSLIALSLASQEKSKQKIDSMKQPRGENKSPIADAGPYESVSLRTLEHKQSADMNNEKSTRPK
jgi:hypothetical protein